MLYQETQKQQEFARAIISGRYKFILYGGAIRGGKTYAMLGSFVSLSKIFPGSKWVIVRKDLERIKNTLFPTFEKIVPSNFTQKMPTQSNGWAWLAKNGSQIKFFAENYARDKELLRFRGLEYDGIGLEEMDVSYDAFLVSLQRCGTWNMGKRKKDKQAGIPIPPQIVLGTSNPQRGWVKKKIYDNWKEGSLNARYLYMPSLVFDNEYVDEDWIAMQKETLPTHIYQGMIMGDWDIHVNEAPFFPSFVKAKHYANKKFLPDPNYPLWLGFDFNIDPTTAVIGQKKEFGCFLIDSMQSRGTESLCELIKERYGHHQAGFVITGDRSGNSGNSAAGTLQGGDYNTDYEIIKRAFGLSASDFVDTRTANARHALSYRFINRFLEHAPFLIAQGLDDLVDEIEAAQLADKQKLELYKNRTLGFGMDRVDAFRYLVHAWFDSLNSAVLDQYCRGGDLQTWRKYWLG